MKIKLLKVVSDNDLPVVEILEKGLFKGQPSIIMKKYVQGSKEIVKRKKLSMRLWGSSPYLYQNSVSDLLKIKSQLINKKVCIIDLQFLIRKKVGWL